ncbi:PspC domain-containing protein [Sphingomonas yunnanensis]|uniref:PspC domain-containing protein n=1 Tax=Sphingomonas yunnanensis TaxID=310400 RepID=UPI001CA79C90|nr:PspC domain-containing protein [Sphingomonas yunnanensis]MBY9061408.1 PspC domain-containing protein [Sphingomonas yunnanensis]
MTETTTPPAPRDNLLGVCAAVGEDLGFNPLWLRAAFAGALLFSLEAVLATYAALGVIVLASRLLFPDRRRASAIAEVTRLPLTARPIEEEPLRRAA